MVIARRLAAALMTVRLRDADRDLEFDPDRDLEFDPDRDPDRDLGRERQAS